MAKKEKWVAEIKITTRKELEDLYKEMGHDSDDYDIEDFNEVEISVIRKDEDLGFRSFGWGGMNKIILFGDDEYTKEDIEWAKKVAHTFADALNEKGL